MEQEVSDFENFAVSLLRDLEWADPNKGNDACRVTQTVEDCRKQIDDNLVCNGSATIDQLHNVDGFRLDGNLNVRDRLVDMRSVTTATKAR